MVIIKKMKWCFLNKVIVGEGGDNISLIRLDDSLYDNEMWNLIARLNYLYMDTAELLLDFHRILHWISVEFSVAVD